MGTVILTSHAILELKETMDVKVHVVRPRQYICSCCFTSSPDDWFLSCSCVQTDSGPINFFSILMNERYYF